MTDRPTCKTCRFWSPARREDEETPQGKLYADTEAECRIRAPHIADDFRRARWPLTMAFVGCGEHEPVCAQRARGCTIETDHVHEIEHEGPARPRCGKPCYGGMPCTLENDHAGACFL